MAQVMILAAGRGTRLKALTAELPKPLVPVGDRPILRHLLDYLVSHGQTEAVINTHHLAHCFDSFDPGLVHLDRVHEPTLRGTAGGVAGARRYLSPACVVWNADIFTQPPLQALLEASQCQPLCLLVSHSRRAVGSGTLGLDATGHVVRLRGETFGVEEHSTDYVGIAALGADVMRNLPPQGCLVGDVCLPWLRRGGSISTLVHEKPWCDIGTPSAYLSLNCDWLRSTGRESYISDGAVVSPAVRVVDSVVGDAAGVSGKGELKRCVLWPGAQVQAPLCNQIVTASGRRVSVHE